MRTSWSEILQYLPFDLTIIVQNGPLFLRGLVNTIILVSVPLLLATVLAIPLALIRVKRIPLLSTVVFGYTYVFRGTPLLVQLYLLYFGAAQFEAVRNSFLWFILRDAWWCALISITLCSAAYITEILRGAMEATPRGEIEAAKGGGSFEIVEAFDLGLLIGQNAEAEQRGLAAARFHSFFAAPLQQLRRHREGPRRHQSGALTH